MRRSSLLGAAVLCLLVGAAGCGGGDGDSEDDIKKQLVEGFRDDVGYTEKQAGCYADIVIDEIGIERLKDVDLADDEPFDDLQDEISAAAIRANDECDLPPLGG